MAQPLTNLTKKNVQFTWSEECETAFKRLKESLISAPILTYPSSEGIFVLDTDASAHMVGAVLSQKQDGEERVIAYGSRTLNSAQKQYCTTKRELLAVVTFVQHFKNYLIGRRFLLRTDHAPLIWLKNFKEPEGMLARWISILENFDFEIQYRAGPKHGNADALSRRPPRKCKNINCPDCHVTNQGIIQNEVDLVAPITGEKSHGATFSGDGGSVVPADIQPNWLKIWTHNELLDFQMNDPDIHFMLDCKQSNPIKPKWADIAGKSRECKQLWSQWEVLEVCDGLLYRRNHKVAVTSQLQLVAPCQIRDEIFTQLHLNRVAGHFGRDRTTEAIKRRFYWPGMTKTVQSWCQACDLCARCKPGPGGGRSCLKQFKVGCPMQCVALDILGPLPITRNGNEYILVIGDYFTKWKEAFALPNHRAQTVADTIIPEFFCRFGCPEQLHTD